MKFLQQFISATLILSFAAAGAVGLSPVLHQWVEHGGQGSAHVHYLSAANGTAAAVWHDHSNQVRQLPVERLHPAVAVRSHKTPSRSAMLLSRLARALNKGCTGHTPAVSSKPDAPVPPNHDHQSLPQLLAGGLVDQSFNFPPLPPPPAIGTFLSSAADRLVLAADWNAQTASRGPPVTRS